MSRIFRKANSKLHMYLGLLSGIIVFIVCITGCLYVFKDEITDYKQHWKFVIPEEKQILLPSEILKISNAEIHNSTPAAITYGERTDAVIVDYYDPKVGMTTVYVNPYNGQIAKTIITKPDDFDFFRFVITGHKTLWLPPAIGKPLVGFGVIFFVIALITGYLLGRPKKWTRKTIRQVLMIKTKAPWQRVNFDIHRVLGGYSVLILVILSLTGLIRSFNWFSEAVYYATSGGKELKPYVLPKSIISDNPVQQPFLLDKLYSQLKQEEPSAKTFYFALPAAKDDVIRVSIVYERNSYYKTDNLFFDQYTLQPLEGSGPYAGKYSAVSAADKLRRMNLDIHNGHILGLFGKILAFLASLAGASLPITGIIIWFRKLKRKIS